MRAILFLALLAIASPAFAGPPLTSTPATLTVTVSGCGPKWDGVYTAALVKDTPGVYQWQAASPSGRGVTVSAITQKGDYTLLSVSAGGSPIVLPSWNMKADLDAASWDETAAGPVGSVRVEG